MPTPTSSYPALNATVGRRLRELRLEQGFSQADFARRLNISPAYLNLIEKGRRTVQLPLLWRALELLGLEPEPFISSLGEQHVEQSLAQLLDEPLLRSLNLDKDAVASLSAEPRAVTTITALFNLYKNTRTQLDNMIQLLARREADQKVRASFDDSSEIADSTLRFDYSPMDEVADFLQDRHNHFPELEEVSLAVRRDFALERRVLSDQLARVLTGIGVNVSGRPSGSGTSVVRRYDPATSTLEISPELSEARRKFDLAHVIGLRLLEERGLHAAITADYRARHPETVKLIKVHLANYFAGALLMPYDDFFHEAQRTRYDVDRLSDLFEMNYEAAAHRITNLSDARRRGVPMHFLRVDVAGNISKRYSATGLSFPSGIGSCSKWVAHTAFLTPSVISKQFSVLPDNTAFFCFAKIASFPIHGSLVKGTVYSIGLGTHAEDAHHLAYADDHPRWAPDRADKIAVPAGVTCRFCERTDCNQRAAPSYKFAFSPDEYVKKDNFFSPILESEAGRPRRLEVWRSPESDEDAALRQRGE
ncbi:MAG TPA: short-chain fatty acyl-CoA regulator family protein [Polyangiaceae bacterium]|nr:short-chain fatty acyl-CoA regulator family protein [Polyangiaceae bacterium]